MSNIVSAINEELICNGVNSLDSLIESGIQMPVIINLLKNNSKIYKKLNKEQMHDLINYIIDYDNINEKSIIHSR